MAERSVAQSRASVMIYNNDLKKWEHAGNSQGPSRVQVFFNSNNDSYRIVGWKINDNEVVINCSIGRTLKYNKATPTFHQWRDQRQVYGLNFQSADDATTFSEAVLGAVDFLNSPKVSVTIDMHQDVPITVVVGEPTDQQVDQMIATNKEYTAESVEHLPDMKSFSVENVENEDGLVDETKVSGNDTSAQAEGVITVELVPGSNPSSYNDDIIKNSEIMPTPEMPMSDLDVDEAAIRQEDGCSSTSADKCENKEELREESLQEKLDRLQNKYGMNEPKEELHSAVSQPIEIEDPPPQQNGYDSRHHDDNRPSRPTIVQQTPARAPEPPKSIPQPPQPPPIVSNVPPSTPAPPPPPVPGVPPAPPAPPGPPVPSGGAPPPPPPPPIGGGAGPPAPPPPAIGGAGGGLAGALANVQLKKRSEMTEDRRPPPAASNPMGNMMDALTKKLQARKKMAETDSNDGASPAPAPTPAPAVQKSVAPPTLNKTPPSFNKPTNVVNPNKNNFQRSSSVSSSDLSAIKEEILQCIRDEVKAAKQEIIEALRQELKNIPT